MRTSTRWRITPAGWVVVALAVMAESISNALRAYSLGTHLERFTIHYNGYEFSVAGTVLVIAAIAVSLSQARAAWVALTPGSTLQRVVASFAAILLISISVTAMSAHILEAQRAKVADEGVDRGKYDRAEAEYKAAAAELQALGTPRPVPVIQADVQAARIEPHIWKRSNQCSDVTAPESKTACAPILELYKERGNAARKLELEPQVAALRDELAKLPRTEKADEVETTASGYWAWIMGIGVVFIATFGSVLFAKIETIEVKAETAPTVTPAASLALPVPPAPPKPRKRLPRKERVQESIREYTEKHGHPPPFKLVMTRHRLPKATASRYLTEAKKQMV